MRNISLTQKIEGFNQQATSSSANEDDNDGQSGPQDAEPMMDERPLREHRPPARMEDYIT